MSLDTVVIDPYRPQTSDRGDAPAVALPPVAPTPLKPPRYAVLACASLFLFFPTAIPALAASFGVDEAWYTGNLEEARRRSRRALTWSLVSVAAGVVAALLLVVAVVTAVNSVMQTVSPALDTLSSVNGLLGGGSAPSGADAGGLSGLGGLLGGADGQIDAKDLGDLAGQLGGLLGEMSSQ